MRRYPPPKFPATGQHTGYSPGRDRRAQQRFRDALIARSGGQCEWPGCTRTITDGVEAHHDHNGYTADCGRLLCHEHHKLAA